MKEMPEDNLTIALNSYQKSSLVEKNQLISKVYDILKKAACGRLRQHSKSELTPTVLVHESFLKLFTNEQNWQSREHFFAVASNAMRQIMVDLARSRNAQKRGRDSQEITYNEEFIADDEQEKSVIQVNEALKNLESTNPELVQIVELKFYIGLSNDEVAEALGISRRTVHRRWDEAKKLVQQQLNTL